MINGGRVVIAGDHYDAQVLRCVEGFLKGFHSMLDERAKKGFVVEQVTCDKEEISLLSGQFGSF
jgi:hypothetical protein